MDYEFVVEYYVNDVQLLLLYVLMRAYVDEIVMYSVYNNDADDDDKVYVVENDIEMKMDDQAMVVDIVLLRFVVDLLLHDVKVMVVNVLIQTKNFKLN